MSRDIEYTVKLNYAKAQAAARMLYSDFSRMNTTFKTTISMNIVDNVTKKLTGIFNMLGGEGGFTRLFSFDSPGITNKLKKLRASISSIFDSDSNKKWFEKTVGYFKDLSKQAFKLGEILVAAFSVGGAAITTGIAVASAFLTKQLIKINSEMEQFEVSLQTTLGSLTAAKQEMAGIVQFAKDTPYQINQVTAAVVKLRAYSMDSDKWLEPLGNAASAFGRDITDAVEMAADAVQGMFRRALSYGIKMEKADFKQGGKYAGMTYADALMMELQKRFKGGMELQSKTLKGILSNIKDSLYISFQEATKPIYGVIKQQVQTLYEYLGSKQGQAKLQQLFGIMADMLNNMINAAKKVFAFIQANIIPIAQTTGKAMLEVFSAVSEMVKPLLTALQPLLVAFTSIFQVLSWIVTQSKLALQIFVAFSAVTKIMNMLGFSVGKLATNMVATNRAATMLSATMKTMGMTIGIAAVSFAAMWAIGNYMEIKNNLKEIGNEIYNVAKGADQVKGYLKEIGAETGHTLKEMTKIALAAKEFGHNMPNVIEVASQLAGKSKKGYAKTLGDFGYDEAAITEATGRLAEAFIKEGDSFEQMASKTELAGAMLNNLNNASEITGISFNDMAVAIESNREVLAAYADDVGELTFLIAQFGKAAKEKGIEANAGQLLDAIGQLLTPTKEMLLSLPIDTWIIKPLKDLDLDALTQTLSDALDMIDVETALSRIDTTSDILIDASKITKENLEKGAEKLTDAAVAMAAIQSGGGGTGLPSVERAGFNEKTLDFLGTWQGVAVEISSSVALFVLYMKYLNKSVKGIERNILRFVAGKISSNILVKLDAKLFAKDLGKSFSARIEKATEIQTERLTKEYAKKIETLEKELKGVNQSLEKGQLSFLKKGGFGEGLKAIPEGMPIQEFISKAPEEIFKKMSEAQLKAFSFWEDAYIAKAKELESKLASTRIEAAEAIEKMRTSYQELADAVKKGRVPATMRELVNEIKELTKSTQIVTSILGRFRKTSSTTVGTEAAKAATESIPKVRRAFGAMFLNLLDIKAYKKMLEPFRKGINLRTTRNAAVGYERFTGDILATESVEKARGRAFALTIQPYFAKLQGKLRNIVSGKFGGQRGSISLEPLAKILDKFGIKTGDIADQYAKTMKEAEGIFSKFNLPHDVKVTLNDLGAKPSKLFGKMINSLGEIEYSAANWFGFRPSGSVLKTAGVTGEIVDLAPLKSIIEYDIYTSKELLSTTRGLSLFMHELGHAITAQTKVGLGYLQEKAKFGGQGFVTPTVVADEKAAWEAGRAFLKEAKVGAEILKEYTKVMNESLKTYTDMVSFTGRDIKGRFTKGNQYQFTSENAPRMYSATETFKEFYAKIGGLVSKTDAKVMFENLVKERVQEVKILEDASSISKNLNTLNKSLSVALIYQIIGEVGNAVLVPYLEKLRDKGSTGAAYGLAVWKTVFSAPAMKAASGALSGWLVADIATGVAKGVVEGRALSGTAGAIRGGMVAGAESTVVLTGALMAIERWTEIFSKGIEENKFKSYTGEEFNIDTGEAWSAKSIGLDLLVNLGKVGTPAAKALKGVVDVVASIPERMGGLFVGGWGRTGEGAAGVTSMTETIYGKGSYFAEREKQIEKAYEKNKNTAEREASYKILLEEQVEQKVEFLATRREAVFSVLSERIKEQYNTLAEAGKAVPQDLVDELARAGEWVKNNVSWGTDIATQLADGTYVLKDSIIDDFESAGKMAANAFSAIAEKELAKYDLSSAAGFKKFLEDIDTGNISEDFKKLFKDVDAGKIAFTLGVEALRKYDEQAIALEEEIAGLNAQITELTTSISEMDYKLSIAGQTLENVSSAFDLAIAINELELVSDKAQGLEVDIANLNAELARSEMEMLPLQRALDKTQKEFDAIQDAIDKTQQKLDAFMNAPVEGEGAYREQRYQLERQISQTEQELELAQRKFKPLESIGLSGSSIEVDTLEGKLAELQDKLDDLDFNREQITAPVEHAKDMAELAQQGAEKSAQAIIDGIKLESDKLAILQQQSSEKQSELDLAQSLVDKKQEEIDKISNSIEWKEKELEVIQKQVEANNALIKAAKKRAEQESLINETKAKIVELDTKVLGIEGSITAQKLVQNAQDYAAGLLSKEQLETMITMYNTVAKQQADITGKKTLKEFDVAKLQQDLATKTTEQSSLAEKIDALTKQLQSMPEGVTPSALTKEDLSNLFGPNVGSLIAHMNSNIGSMETNIAALAAGKEGAVLSYAAGGIELAKERLVKIHGPEAIIPLQNGSVPVTLSGATTGNQTVSIKNTFGNMTFVVNNDQELEEIKEAIINLKTGNTSFFSRASQYNDGF